MACPFGFLLAFAILQQLPSVDSRELRGKAVPHAAESDFAGERVSLLQSRNALHDVDDESDFDDDEASQTSS
jgi:hypothetical protein